MIADFIFLLSLFAVLGLTHYRILRFSKHEELSEQCTPPRVEKNEIVFRGRTLELQDEQLHLILNRRNHYYNQLDEAHQSLFRKRLKKFIAHKTFVIKDDEAFSEMPVLVSASAIQLTFGLKSFLLPFYKYIRIFPEEYFADNSIKVLAGNVQGYTISIAWNHFLKGYENKNDGSNVGLHEMSHALYFQHIVVDQNFSGKFSSRYKQLLNECYDAHKTEEKGQEDLYSDYATTSMQEFWAESVELFFEKPVSLFSTYPDVYEAMRILLNQDPQYPDDPLVEDNRSFREKMNKLRIARHLLKMK